MGTLPDSVLLERIEILCGKSAPIGSMTDGKRRCPTGRRFWLKRKRIAGGGEAVVWFDRKRSVAVKAIGLDYYGSPTLALERVELHNKYFPDTKLSLVGFGEIPEIEIHATVAH